MKKPDRVEETKIVTPEERWDSTFSKEREHRPGATRQKVRKISPLGMRVVVRIRRDANQTESGLYLPEGAKEDMHESLLGDVVEVASAVDDETTEEANISGVPLGSTVLIPKKAGVKVPWDESLRIVDTKEVLALVHEVNVT